MSLWPEPTPWDRAQGARAIRESMRRQREEGPTRVPIAEPAKPPAPKPAAPKPLPRVKAKPKPALPLPPPPPSITIPEGSVILSREEYQAVKNLMRAVPELNDDKRRRHRGGTQRF